MNTEVATLEAKVTTLDNEVATAKNYNAVMTKKVSELKTDVVNSTGQQENAWTTSRDKRYREALSDEVALESNIMFLLKEYRKS